MVLGERERERDLVCDLLRDLLRDLVRSLDMDFMGGSGSMGSGASTLVLVSSLMLAVDRGISVVESVDSKGDSITLTNPNL